MPCEPDCGSPLHATANMASEQSSPVTHDPLEVAFMKGFGGARGVPQPGRMLSGLPRRVAKVHNPRIVPNGCANSAKSSETGIVPDAIVFADAVPGHVISQAK